MERRNFIKTTMAGTPLIYFAPGSFLSTREMGAEVKGGSWFMNRPRVYLLDFQLPDPLDQGVPGMPHFLQNIDPEKIVRQLKEAGSTALLAHTKDHEGNAYYNTKIGHKHSDLGTIDLIAEFSKYTRKYGMQLLFYYSIAWEQRAWKEHPDFRAKNSNGTDFIYTRELNTRTPITRWTVCTNGPYRQYMNGMLKELTENYEFEGYWLDIPRAPICYCDFCKKDYLEKTGKNMPVDLYSRDGLEFRKWHFALSTEIANSWVSAIREVKPQVTIASNGISYSYDFGWDAIDAQDYPSREYHAKEGVASVSFYSLQQKALKRNVPFEIEIWRHSYGAREGTLRTQCVRNVSVLTTEMAAVVSHGGFVQYYDQVQMDGTLSERSLSLLKPAFETIRNGQPWTGVGTPVPYAMILWSKQTTMFGSSEMVRLHSTGMLGSFLAMQETHIPVGVVAERDVEIGEYGGAKVIIVPSVECLSDKCIAGLDDFVKKGGGLVVTDKSSMKNEFGQSRENFGLKELLGLDFKGTTEFIYSYYINDKKHPVTDKNLWLGFANSVHDNFQAHVAANSEVEVLGEIMDEVPGFKIDLMPHKRTGWPSLIVRNYGKGRVVYHTAPLCSMYERFSHLDQRNLIENAVRWAGQAPVPIEVQAPETVEVIPWRDEPNKRTIIHVVNRTGAGLAQGPGALQHETIPVHDIQIKILSELGGKTVMAQPGNRKVKTSSEDNYQVINLGKVENWEIIEIS